MFTKDENSCYGALNWDGKSPSTFHCPDCAFSSGIMKYFPHTRVEHRNRRKDDNDRTKMGNQ